MLLNILACCSESTGAQSIYPVNGVHAYGFQVIVNPGELARISLREDLGEPVQPRSLVVQPQLREDIG